MENKVYFVYAKGGNMKRWAPVGEDGPQANLLCAYSFKEKEHADKYREQLAEAIPNFEFEVRSK